MSFRAMLLTMVTGSVFVAATARAQVPPEHQYGTPPAVAPSLVTAQPVHEDLTPRSPGLAVALSLTPLPVDFGNLYAENPGWGVAYTVAEVALMTPMMWFMGRHMAHNGSDDRRWNGEERALVSGLVAGYVTVKIAAGIHASYAAREFNRGSATRTSAMFVQTKGGGLLGWQRTF